MTTTPLNPPHVDHSTLTAEDIDRMARAGEPFTSVPHPLRARRALHRPPRRRPG